jgi:hypothetical protein
MSFQLPMISPVYCLTTNLEPANLDWRAVGFSVSKGGRTHQPIISRNENLPGINRGGTGRLY